MTCYARHRHALEGGGGGEGERDAIWLCLAHYRLYNTAVL